LLTFDTRASSSYLDPVYSDTLTQVYRFDGLRNVNFGASYRLPLSESKAIRFFARAENVLNETYYEGGFQTPGRTGRAGLQFEY
jgi:outer membrane receptor protein involved in Fe transport